MKRLRPDLDYSGFPSFNPFINQPLQTKTAIKIIIVAVVLMIIAYFSYDYFYQENTVKSIKYQDDKIIMTFVDGDKKTVKKDKVTKVTVSCYSGNHHCSRAGVVIYSNDKKYKTEQILSVEDAKQLRKEIYENLKK